MRFRNSAVATLVVGLVACGGGNASTTTLPVAPTTSTAVPDQTTTPPTSVGTDTTLPEVLPPLVTAPSVSPRPRRAVEPCDEPEGTDYCVWGTSPIDLTVNNSRRATFVTSVRQTFVALSEEVESVRLVIGATGSGGFSSVAAGAPLSSVCLSVVLSTETGLEVGRLDLESTDTRGVVEDITSPLLIGLLPGTVYAIAIEAMPGCAGKIFATMVAMSSDWKYPAASGRLEIDGRRSSGSIWAEVD